MDSLSLKRYNFSQNENNKNIRKVAHCFISTPLVFKLQNEFLKFSDTCGSWSSPKTDRSSHQSCSVKKGVLRNFAKIHRKTSVPESLFNKVEGAVCNFIKKLTLAQVLSCEFCEISKNTFSGNTSGRLLLNLPGEEFFKLRKPKF